MLGGSVLAARRVAAAATASSTARGTWGFIDKTGRTVIPPQFTDASSFSEGLAAVKVENAWGFIDTAGKVVIRPQFDAVFPFSQRRAAVRIGRDTGYIDSTGAAATPMHFSTMLPFREGRAAVSSGPAGPPGSPSPSWGYIDLDGKVVVAPQHDRVSYFSEGLAAVARDGKAGFIDATGAVVIPLQFERAHPFASGRAGVKINGKWGYIDRTGTIVIPPRFHFVWPYYAEGVARFDKWGYRCGYIDENGKVIVKPTLEEAEEFVGGIAAAKKKRGKWGFINRTGKFVIPAEYRRRLFVHIGRPRPGRTRPENRPGPRDADARSHPDRARCLRIHRQERAHGHPVPIRGRTRFRRRPCARQLRGRLVVNERRDSSQPGRFSPQR